MSKGHLSNSLLLSSKVQLAVKGIVSPQAVASCDPSKNFMTQL